MEVYSFQHVVLTKSAEQLVLSYLFNVPNTYTSINGVFYVGDSMSQFNYSVAQFIHGVGTSE